MKPLIMNIYALDSCTDYPFVFIKYYSMHVIRLHILYMGIIKKICQNTAGQTRETYNIIICNIIDDAMYYMF